jgi:hypothetical protein
MLASIFGRLFMVGRLHPQKYVMVLIYCLRPGLFLIVLCIHSGVVYLFAILLGSVLGGLYDHSAMAAELFGCGSWAGDGIILTMDGLGSLAPMLVG